MDICDQLEFTDLISFAKTHLHTCEVVEIVIKQKISNKSITIFNGIQNVSTIRFENGQSSITDFGSILYFFRNFAHHITHLVVERFGENNQTKVFKSYISKYAAAHLI